MKTEPSLASKSLENRITRDWQRHLPALAIFRPRHLLRRVGPLLAGVILERDSGGDVYKPCFHVHFLGKRFPCVSLTMCTQLRAKSGGPDYIEVRFHEAKYEDAIRRLVEQAPLPIEGPLSLDQVLHAYREFSTTPLGRRQAAHLYGDCIMLLCWCGRIDAAREMLEEALQVIHDEPVFRPFGGRQQFERSMQDAIEHPAAIEHTVDSQIQALGLRDIPAEEFAN